MRVNASKTGLICISGAISYDPRAHLFDDRKQQLSGTKTLKVLGFRFDSDGGVWSQVNHIKGRLRSRTWALQKLKRCGLSTKELLQVYVSTIRPVAEYASVALHSMLTFEQSRLIERQQDKALQFIYGVGISAEKMRKMADLETLAKRRFKACKKFAERALDSEKFRHWFPMRPVPSRPTVSRGTRSPPGDTTSFNRGSSADSP